MRCWPLFSVLSIPTRRVQPSLLTSQCSLLSGDLVGSSLWSTCGTSTTSYISPGARHPHCSCTQSPSVVGCLRSGSRLMHLVPETLPNPDPASQWAVILKWPEYSKLWVRLKPSSLATLPRAFLFRYDTGWVPFSAWLPDLITLILRPELLTQYCILLIIFYVT